MTKMTTLLEQKRANHHHQEQQHYPSAAKQAITRFHHAPRSLASVAISSADISTS